MDMRRPDDEQLPAKQREILRLLLERPYMQKDLAAALDISGAGLFYHVNLLEESKLITRRVIAEVGNVSLKEVSLDPGAYQRARRILGIEPGATTLVTAFGRDSELGDSHTIPSTVRSLLQREGYRVDRVVAFVTPESNLAAAAKLAPIDFHHTFEYETFRDDTSQGMQDLPRLVQQELKDADVMIDVTGLTKLLTIKLLDLAHQFKLPCVYLGKRPDKSDFLLWIRR